MVRLEEVPREVDLERHPTGDGAGHDRSRGPPVHVLGHPHLPPAREAAADFGGVDRLPRAWRK